MNDPESVPPSKRGVLLLTVLVNSFVVPFLISSVNVALPAIGRDLHITANGLGWIVSAYLLAILVVLVPAGRFADHAGQARVFFAGSAVFTLGSLLCGFAPDFGTLCGFRAVQAVGAGMQLATGTALLVSAFPPDERGRVIGLNVSVVYIGLAAGPFIGGWLVHLLSWRWLFFLNVPLGLAVSLLTLSFIDSGYQKGRTGIFDITGTVLYGSLVLCLGLGLPVITRPFGILLFCVGIVLFAVLLRVETRQPFPVLELSLFRGNRTFSYSSVAALINYGATYSVGFLLSLYLQYVKGLSPFETGLTLVIQPVVMAVVAPVAGRMSDRIESGVISTIGMILTAAGLAGLSLLSPATPLFPVLLDLGVLGIGFGLFSAPNTNAIMSSVPRNHLGSASAMVSTMRLAGQLFSIAVLILISSVFLAGKPVIPAHFQAFMASFRTSCVLFCGLCCIGIYFSSARGVMRAKTAGRRSFPVSGV